MQVSQVICGHLQTHPCRRHPLCETPTLYILRHLYVFLTHFLEMNSLLLLLPALAHTFEHLFLPLQFDAQLMIML